MTTRLTRRDLLKASGAALAALSVGRPAHAQAPKPGGTFVSAQTTEATGLDPQLVPAFSRSRRSPMMYNQLVRFDAEMTPVPELADRKSTRLNSSHGYISYAVFCLKKKNFRD